MPSGPQQPPPAAPIPAWAALIPVVALVALLVGILLVLPRMHADFTGSGHIPLVLAAAIAAIVARGFGHSWTQLERGIVEALRLALPAVLIMLLIGILMGTWIIAGIVPALVDAGLALLSPRVFLPATCAVCSVVSIISGSSWSTAGTIGLALVGIGNAMGLDPAVTAGAVISGAYFGDKLSPMSDTTNLAPAMAGTDLFTHIGHMLWTSGPAWVFAMLGYTALGWDSAPVGEAARLAAISAVLEAHFTPSWLHFVPPLVVLGLVLRRVPPLPSLFTGVMLGAALALLRDVSVADVIAASLTGYRAHTGLQEVDNLLSRGGLLGMADTLMLIFAAMAFGGIMEASGMLATLAGRLLSAARSTTALVLATLATALGTNVLAAEQYVALVVPGRMFTTAYRERGLAPENLSRALEDGGTMTSALVPWNTCGAFMSATLGVATLSYLPFAFVNLLSPVISAIYAVTGWTLKSIRPSPVTTSPTSGPTSGSR